MGALGFIFWQNFIHKEAVVTEGFTTKTPTSVNTEKDTKQLTIGNVTFDTPKNWSQDMSIESVPDSTLVGAMSFLPGEKIRTVYGDGNEFFHIRVGVYKNQKNYTPEDWFINDGGSGGIGGQGILSNDDTESKEKISTNEAYYRNTVNSSYEEVHYVIGRGDTLVYIYARTYDTSDDLPGVGDFKKFEPAIAELAKSVMFN
jgi:hypothetical protein